MKERAVDALEYIIHDVVYQTLTDNKSCLTVKTIFEVAPLDLVVKLVLLKRGNTLQSILENLIVQGQKDVDSKSKRDANIIAKYILSTISINWSHYILSNNKIEIIEMVDFMTEQIRC